MSLRIVQPFLIVITWNLYFMGGSSFPLRSPLRIEAADLVSLEGGDNVLESAIMLFNLGLAHLCMAKLDNSIMLLSFGLANLCMAKLDKKTPIQLTRRGTQAIQNGVLRTRIIM
jgi:hypothetical protein